MPDPWSSSLPSTVPTFTPTPADMEFESGGLLVSSLYGENNDGELIIVGPDLTADRARAAAIDYADSILSWTGHDAAAELQQQLDSQQMVLAIAPTVFIRQHDGSWDIQRHADGQPAAWLVNPWHPAHCFTTT